MTGMPPRRSALRTLERVRKGEPFDAAFDRSIGRLAEDDRRLAHELSAGVLRSQSALDARLATLVPRGWNGVAATLQDVLRLGAYQLTALDRVPPHAAVSTSVELAREAGGTRAGGFVNAVLRQIASHPEAPASNAPDDSVRLAEAHSHPEWLVRRWIDRFGMAGTVELLARNNTRPSLLLQAARAPLSVLRERWEAAGIPVTPAPYGAGLMTDRTHPRELPGFVEGDFVVQDPAQALVAWFADLPPGATVYDACAAPGGKAIALGRNARALVAADVSTRRTERLAANIARAGSGREHVIVADAIHPPVRAVSAVLLDAPCLGTGTFARHPDARWRVTPEALATLAREQRALLDAVSGAVAPGGLLVYATCSLEPEENEDQVDAFLERNPEYRREPSDELPPSLLSPKGDLMLLPHLHGTDGGYAARLRRA
jgi:16S rRNA (cytosine967-C5)-methyltransferase